MHQSIVLASQSPRRRDLLAQWGVPFECHPAHLDEPPKDSDEPLERYVVRVAEDKAHIIAKRFPDRIVLGADTVVVLDEKILGKPKDDEDAKKFLRSLSKRWHEVWTGVSLLCLDEGFHFGEASVTRVLFRELAESEIVDYVLSGEPSDKAGAYAIQGGAAGFVNRIEGPWDNVVGLPRDAVFHGLEKSGFQTT